MSLIEAVCVEFKDKRKVCVASENGKTYTLNNESELVLRKVKVDKCISQNAGEKRCDFLMDIDDLKRVFFIELKGGDLNKAINQIHSTILFLKDEFKDYRIDARIVGSKDVPRFINTPDYKKLAKEIYPTKGDIKRGTNNTYTEKV